MILKFYFIFSFLPNLAKSSYRWLPLQLYHKIGKKKHCPTSINHPFHGASFHCQFTGTHLHMSRQKLASKVHPSIAVFFFPAEFSFFLEKEIGKFFFHSVNSTSYALFFFVKFRQIFDMKKWTLKKNTESTESTWSHKAGHWLRS